MITEKLKHTGIILAMGVIALGTVTMALLAYEGPHAKPARLASDSAVQDGERNKPHETKAIPLAKTAVDDPEQRENQARLRAEAELEESYQKLDRHLASASLLQLELDITTKRIEKTSELLANPELRFVAENSRLTATEREHAMKTQAEKRERMIEELEGRKRYYTELWASLAALKRQIVRQSKALGVTPESALPNGSELTRRLDALEKKLDRIIHALPAK